MMLFVSVSCLLFGINLYCNSGLPCPPLTKATLSFHGKNVSTYHSEMLGEKFVLMWQSPGPQDVGRAMSK